MAAAWMVGSLTAQNPHATPPALAVGARALPPYAHKYSPKKYTQPQLFACLVLKTFLKTDYRGLAAHLADHSDLRAALGLAGRRGYRRRPSHAGGPAPGQRRGPRPPPELHRWRLRF